jgi:hypothetical protein
MGGSHLSEWAPLRRWPVRRRPPHSRLSLTLTASSRSRSSLSSFSNRSTSSGMTSHAGQRNQPGFSLTTSERTSRIWPTRRVLRTNGAGVRLSAPGLPGAHRAGPETSTMQRTCQWTSHGTSRRVDDAARPGEGARRVDDLVGGKRVPVLLRERWCHQRNLQGSRCVSCQDGLGQCRRLLRASFRRSLSRADESSSATGPRDGAVEARAPRDLEAFRELPIQVSQRDPSESFLSETRDLRG